ncbi:hypothetical protein [Chromobacterium haemolyticum]|uniref:hypothetical protein n=1 Tax=Chromobacterium haemolyticum TaxID=394935 RepID=UPI00244A4879|nr:hypothetical protein [Chromobacterium haemolyticum]MDH0340256.1 hypothetical protein [Chromobacterium haemolyticum]
MSLSRSAFWRMIKNSDKARYLVLALLPLFARPMHFVAQKNKPPYVRLLRGLWTTPIIAAWLTKSGAEQFARMIGWVNYHPKGLSTLAANKQIETVANRIGWGMFAMSIAFIYILAAIQWIFHSVSAKISRKIGWEVTNIPFLFFIAKMATWGLWLGFMTKAMAWVYEKSNGDVIDYINNQIIMAKNYPNIVLMIMLPLIVISHFSTKNYVDGMKEVYGNSNRLLMLVNISSIGLLLLMLFIILHLLK